jgi:geranylgeranylglycerol-phosphate geranylgeranyltransferase
LFVLAAVATLTREIIKDVEDVVGDREEGLRTLPIAIGERAALLVAGVLLVGAVIASPLPWVFDQFGRVYLVCVVPANAVMLGGVAVSFSDPGRGQSYLKYGMLLAVGAFIVGRAAVVTGVGI